MTMPIMPMALAKRVAPLLAALLLLAGCAGGGTGAATTAAARPAPDIVERRGPFQVVCLSNEDGRQVFATTVFRVRRQEGGIDVWQYESANGLRYRGRFDPPNLTCTMDTAETGNAPQTAPDASAPTGEPRGRPGQDLAPADRVGYMPLSFSARTDRHESEHSPRLP